MASAGHIFFTKSISSLLGPLYQMSQSVIVYVSCFQSKYSSWQLKRGLEEWEEGQNVKCRDPQNMKRFVFIWWFIVGRFWNQWVLCALSLQSYQRHSIKHVSSYAALILREGIYLTPYSPFTVVNRHLAVPPTMQTCHPHFSVPLSHTINSWKIIANSLTMWQEPAKFSGQDLVSNITDGSFISYNHKEIINIC